MRFVRVLLAGSTVGLAMATATLILRPQLVGAVSTKLVTPAINAPTLYHGSVSVDVAKVETDYAGQRPVHHLLVKVHNSTNSSISNVVVHYTINQQWQLVSSSSFLVQPFVIGVDGEGVMEVPVDTSGSVVIRKIEWLWADGTYGST